MYQTRFFWIALSLIALVSAAVAYVYFPIAFPLVTLDLRIDRQTALAQARELATKHQWRPDDYRQAASFSLDSTVQTYVELEAGGTEAFRRMLRGGLYSPYTWRVRHFKEGQTVETWIRFTPAGQPYGFFQKLPEDEAGPSLSRDDAQSLAERAATEAWRVDLGAFELVEASHEVRPGGRTDHTLVYRRFAERVGEGEYRLRMVVGGDRLTELTHFVKVPEAFSRRYEEMRSANDTIATISGFAVAVLYVAGGCLVGLAFLARRRWVMPRPALLWGFSISFLQVLVAVNQWPLLWLDYDTALTPQSFMLRQAVSLLAMFLGMGLVFGITFMAAEGLTRRAFGDHIRLWRLWSRSVAHSPCVAGRTIGGYLLVSVFFAYEVGLYFFSSRWLGWWTPSSALFDPDVLAAYFPWLSSIAVSLQAGFWEECLFRAVPIAGAALIGERLGKRRACIIGAFVVQALVFGAAHANYPAQPAYARLVELIIPSLFFGWVYVRFGLLTSIVLHFAFDVTWFALPLFVSTAPGVGLDQMMVVLLTLTPLWVVLGARFRSGRWEPLHEEALNRSWKPSPLGPREEEGGPVEAQKALPGTIKRLFLAGGAACLVAWVFLLDLNIDAPTFQIGRHRALEHARGEISSRGIFLPESWSALTTVRGEGDADMSDRFVWQEGGQGAYRELLGSYLPPPHWSVRFVRFEGDVAERAEEYRVSIAPDGAIFRLQHRLPESRPGARRSEAEARERAYAVLQAAYGLERDQVKEISVAPSKLPHRRDWLLTFADQSHYPLDEGEARVAVEIAGDEVVDTRRSVHVPEQWQRQERERQTRAQIVTALCWVVLAACLVGGVAGAIISWSRRRFDRRVFLMAFAAMGGLGLGEFVNSWPTATYRFSTAQPSELQTLISIGLGFLGLLVTAGAPAVLIGYVHAVKSPSSSSARSDRIVLGLALGALPAGIVALVKNWTYPSLPTWPDYSPLGTYVPLYSVAFSPLVGFVRDTAVLLLVFAVVDRASNRWTRRRALLSTGLVVLGLAVGGLASRGDVTAWMASGWTIGLILLAGYVLALRYELALLPLAVGMLQILSVLEAGLRQGFTAALPGALLAAILILWVAILWSGKLQEHPPGPLTAG